MRREGAVRRHYARVALPLMLVALSVTVIQYQIPTIMERVMDEFSMDAGSASWLMSVFTLVGIVAALPVGGLAGRVGAKRLMVCLLYTSRAERFLGRVIVGCSLWLADSPAPHVVQIGFMARRARGCAWLDGFAA